MLPLWGSLVVESVCVLAMAAEMWLKVFYMSSRQFFSSAWHVLQFLLLLLDSLGIAITAVSPTTLTFFNPMLRPMIFVAMSGRVRRAFGSFFRLIPLVAEWGLMVLLLLGFYAVTGVLIMGRNRPLLGANQEGAFDTIPDALLSLTVLLTTANFPDVMLPAYDQSRAVAIFFVSFLLICLFLLMNLVLATVFQHYKQSARASAASATEARAVSLQRAFILLDCNQNGFVELADFSQLLVRISRPVFSLFDGETHSGVDTAHTKAVLQHLLHRDPSLPLHGLALSAFSECMLALRRNPRSSFRMWEDEAESLASEPSQASERETSCEHCFAWCFESLLSTAKAMMRKHYKFFELLMGLIVVANAALLVVQVELRQAEGRRNEHKKVLAMAIEHSAPVFDALYVLEAALKLWCVGSRRYVSSSANIFDLSVLVVTFGADLTLWAAAEGQYDARMPVVFFIRSLRLLRLLRFTIANEVFDHFLRLLPAFAGLIGALVVLFTLYAQMGVLLFGGKLNRTDWARTTSLVETPPLYVLCNFNDFGSAILTLFELLVVNNWHVIMGSVVALTSEASRIYFISWYVLAVAVFFNLVVALFLDGYLAPDAAFEPESADVDTFSANAPRRGSVGSLLQIAAPARRRQAQSVSVEATLDTPGSAPSALAPSGRRACSGSPPSHNEPPLSIEEENTTVGNARRSI